MPDTNFISLLAGGSVFLGLAVALILLRQRTLPARLLAAAMAVAVLNILHGLLMPILLIGVDGILTEPLQFALPPLFAAYVRALLDTAWRPRPRDLLHFLPLVAMSALTGMVSILPGAAAWPAMVLSLGVWILLLVQALAYIGRVIVRLRNYRRALRDEVSTLRGIDQAWLLWFSRALHFLYLVYVAVPAVLLHGGGAGPARHLIGLALCLTVGALAVHQLLANQYPAPIPVREANPSATWDPAIPAALQAAMDERRLFADPGLTLGSLSSALGWPRNEVSAAINGHFNQTFHDFVNAYRVEEAKRLMADPANRAYTLLALGLDAGFNSKPTFNAVFKKTTGMTPSGWLAQHGKV